jgi:hypothetical protein
MDIVAEPDAYDWSHTDEKPSAVRSRTKTPLSNEGIRYFVEPSVEAPDMLARVRWPDVAERILSTDPNWTTFPWLMDMLHTSDGANCTPEFAEKLAAEWGASISLMHDASTERNPRSELVSAVTLER